MPKINTLQLKNRLRTKFPKYKWYVREQQGGMSWAFDVYSYPEIKSEERDEVRKILQKYSKIDRDERSGEILGGGNTYVHYNGEKYW
jgi:hypothetical protein